MKIIAKLLDRNLSRIFIIILVKISSKFITYFKSFYYKNFMNSRSIVLILLFVSMLKFSFSISHRRIKFNIVIVMPKVIS